MVHGSWLRVDVSIFFTRCKVVCSLNIAWSEDRALRGRNLSAVLSGLYGRFGEPTGSHAAFLTPTTARDELRWILHELWDTFLPS